MRTEKAVIVNVGTWDTIQLETVTSTFSTDTTKVLLIARHHGQEVLRWSMSAYGAREIEKAITEILAAAPDD